MKPSVYQIHAGSLEMTVTNYGARVLSLKVPDKAGVPADVVVGYATLDEYLSCPGERFFGAAVGRLANRLGGASFELDGQVYHTAENDNGNTLHGGFLGIDRVLWRVREVRPDAITFLLCSEDGVDGWPGNLDIELSYSLAFQGLKQKLLRKRMGGCHTNQFGIFTSLHVFHGIRKADTAGHYGFLYIISADDAVIFVLREFVPDFGIPFLNHFVIGSR